MKLLKAFAVFYLIITTSLSAKTFQSGTIENIEVPVRIFKGNSFVNNLQLADFEVYEDGIRQKLNALYYFEDNRIIKSEGIKTYFPRKTRDFYLIIEVSKLNVRIRDALQYFIHNVLYPEDNLTIITPVNTYVMKANALRVLSPEDVEQQLVRTLQNDALMRRTEYQSIFSEIMKLTELLEGTKSIDPSQEMDASYISPRFKGFNLARYSYYLEQLERINSVDETKLLNIATLLKNQEGEKNVFLFYQREPIPNIKPNLLSQFIEYNRERPDLVHRLSYLEEFFQRDLSFNVDRLKMAYADASISLDFLFFTKPPRHTREIQIVQKPEELYQVFNEISRGTGGTLDSALDPKTNLRIAKETIRQYYLLYYSPKRQTKSRDFRQVMVKALVHGSDYKIVHRSGYYGR
jgi:hypothetical protein